MKNNLIKISSTVIEFLKRKQNSSKQLLKAMSIKYNNSNKIIIY